MKKSNKRQLRRKAFTGSMHKRASGADISTKAKTEREARSLTGMVKDDIALYLSPLAAVAGEFRRRLRGA
jgi:hypothetical protein